MKKLSLKIGKRLLLAYSLIGITMIITSGYSLLKINEIKTINSSLFERNLKAIDYLLEADRDVYQSRLAILHYINNKLDKQKENLKTEITENLEQVDTRYAKYAAIYKVATNDLFIKHDSVFRHNFP